MIGLSLWKDEVDFTYGALRNVQLAALFFPKWTVRIFIPKTTGASVINIPKNIVLKMEDLGAEVVYIADADRLQIPLSLLSTFVSDDIEAVDYFILRDVRHRLSKRDADAVREWMASDQAVHCIRDHSRHTGNTTKIVSELWGANTRKLNIHLNKKKIIQFIQVEKSMFTCEVIINDNTI